MSNEFSQTRMGQEFYEGTMKSINKNLDRIADALEKLVESQSDNKEALNKIQETLTYLR